MNRFDILWSGYQTGSLTEAEIRELLNLLDDQAGDVNQKIDQLLLDGQTGMSLPGEKNLIFEQVQLKIRSAETEAPVVHKVHVLRKWWWAAAAVIILMGIGGYWRLTSRQEKQVVQQDQPAPAKNDFAPGTIGAILTLSDGRRVVLDSMKNGVVATQGHTAIQLKDGRLQYNSETTAAADAALYNIVTTPKGRQYQVVLPDGTKVWLNAASTLRYPVSFTGAVRAVEVAGEAYFEVVKNSQQPFHVKVKDMEVRVLGTHFNVNAYTDEPAVNTTLLEGSVKVTKGTKMQLLQPGQQAQVNTNNITLIKNANVAQAVAWKNGFFAFHDADLGTVMRQLARWYNIEVVYEGPVPAGTFNGKIDHSLTLSQVLKGLSKTRINYRIEQENKIIIMP